MANKINNLKFNYADGPAEIGFTYTDENGFNYSAGFPLFIIKKAWEKGMDFEDLADGFGKGLGTMGGDWSGIRDSSPEATAKMVERALNNLF